MACESSHRTRQAAAFFAATCLIICQVLKPGASARISRPRKVIFDHDGGIDDYVTLLLLLSAPDRVRVVGITILDADCRVELAWNTTLKLLHTLGHGHIPVAVSSLTAVNAFPDPWRNSVLSVDVLPLINDLTQEELAPLRLATPGEELMAQLLLGRGAPGGGGDAAAAAAAAGDNNNNNHHGNDGDGDDGDDEPITIVATGPLSNVAYVLRKYGAAAAARIREVWWMGGAMWVGGNVVEPGHDGSAEWNAYWDPPAVGEVWGWPSVPLVVVPLDATNAVPVTPELIYRLGRQARYRYSALAGTVWSRVVTWVYDRPNEPYYAWDTLTAACVLQPDLCEKLYDVQSYAVVAGASQGRTVPLAPSPEAAEAAAEAAAAAEGAGGAKGSCAAASPCAEQHGAGEVQRRRMEAEEADMRAALREEASEGGGGAVAVPSLPQQQQHLQQKQKQSHQERGEAEEVVWSATRGVTVVNHVDAEAFYAFVLQALRV
ncbi:hypothetical protein HYH02_014060 [Chlamydomonas schloesseri]|uniref:Inosine/uridine-preferring nucleoside hydrolase domain-containing protein n=1 Tax=Chlamydomonas schloesseri TaxID=2026947 RepID=A0A835VXP0_9CHLO|nr:hypothetical protein HYH02_014060 [Chlamydomonas schloesseri]|eukprot:KAG2429404.1 hypothetical protein HYH02_014060 [Chlamydomonas schloesseri]